MAHVFVALNLYLVRFIVAVFMQHSSIKVVCDQHSHCLPSAVWSLKVKVQLHVACSGGLRMHAFSCMTHLECCPKVAKVGCCKGATVGLFS